MPLPRGTHALALAVAVAALMRASVGEADALGGLSLSNATVRQQQCPQDNQCSFVDHFNSKHGRWWASHDYTNWNPFGSWWSQERAKWWGGRLHLSVWKNARHGHPFATGEVRTHGWFGYGCYEVRMKPVAQPGLISTFFTYTGKENNAPGYPFGHNEIDVEFVWSNRLKKLTLQCNYFTNKKGQHEKRVPLDFKPEAAFHNYAFKWTSKSIQWFVDGKQVHQAWHKPNDPLPFIKKGVKGGPHKIYMNFWVVNQQNGKWGGWYKWQGQKASQYEAVRFTRGENCKIKNWF